MIPFRDTSLIERIKALKKQGILLDKLLPVFFGPFQLVPKQETDNYSKLHLNKGIDYERIFYENEGTRVIWDLEKSVIDSIIKEHFFNKYLDFAGGTGRIAEFVESHCDESYILDISEEMLTVARDRLKKSKVICKDFNDAIPELDDIRFDLITAFRFFPNAEELLRASAMQFISNKLTVGGLLICNNHRNFWSIPYFTQRLIFIGGLNGMSNQQMLNLSERFGLTLINTYSMGIIPQTEKKTLLISWKLTEKIEKFILEFIGKWHRRGYNVIYIFKKNN